MIKVWADTETRSFINLKTAGSARYFEDPTTQVQLFSYAIEDEPVEIWDVDAEPMPAKLRAALDNPRYVFFFHNSFFDWQALEACLGIKLPIERVRCVMAWALSHGLPASLEKLGEVMGLKDDQAKIKDGRRLVMKFCKPHNHMGALKYRDPRDHKQDWERYKEYCIRDTDAMRTIAKKLPKWNYPFNEQELKYWYIDQKLNRRGMHIDLELAEAAMRAVAAEQKVLSKRTKELTREDVSAASQRDAMLKHIAEEYSVYLPDLQKATVEKLLDDPELPAPLKELLEVRLDTCTTATAKFKKLVSCTNVDSRLRGTVQFAGAARTLRDCVAEGSLVAVKDISGDVYEKRIQDVLRSDLVWDGEMWVQHEGVIYNGVKEVIYYEGICATKDHMVYLDSGKSIPLIQAKAQCEPLWKPPLRST